MYRILQLGVGGNLKERRGMVNAVHSGTDYNMPLKYKDMLIEYKQIDGFPIIGSGAQLVVDTLFKNMGRYEIVHNLSQHPMYPINRGHTILVTTAHELQRILYPELNTLLVHSLKDWLWECTVTVPGIKCLLSSDYAIANSTLTYEGLVKAGFPSNRIFLAPLGIPRRYFVPIKLKKKGIFKIGTLGTIGPQKNTFFSIDAVKQMNSRDVVFEIWGKSLYNEKVLLDRIGGDKRIELKGRAPEGDMVSIYDSFDVFVFPSIFEGFGLTALEAKARGIPVILYKGGHIPLEVKEYCFEAKSPAHMAEIIEDIKLNGYDLKLRKKAIASAKKHTTEKMGLDLLKAYQEIMSREGFYEGV